MIGKKINQLATELAPVSTDLTIIGDPISGVSKKITLAQLGAIFSGAVSFYNDLASFPATGDINVIYCAKDTQKLYLWSGSAYTEVFPSQALLDTYQLRSEKGVSNGYASLDSSGKVPISQLPSSIMEYKGTWNAATNTPTLANGTGDTGDVYICNVAGTVNFGAGPITFAVGDYTIYSGSIWQRSSGAVGTVTSVAASITGNAIGITGSPVTTSGTLAFAFAGTGAQYIKGDGTLATFPSTIAQAERLITEVYNSTGATLTKGTIVYINGGQGNLPTVTKALATGDSTSAQTFGVVQADITNNNNGYVVVAGKLSDLDTQAYTEGTQLYLSATTAGTWTSTKQYAPNHLVYVGIVVRAHPTQGIVEIKIQNGYELDELHDVAAQNPDNNDILQYKTSTSLWTKVAGTTSNIAEGSNLYYTDARSRAALSFTAGSGAYNSTTGVITIPTNTNQLTNGAAFITLASLSAGAGISYNNTTGVIASTITQYTDAMARASISLTTTGTSGAATYNSTTGVLNVPQYAPDLSGYVPTSRTLTINGTAYDLSANRSWSVGTVTSVGLSSATSGVTIGSTPITSSGTITIAIATASGTQQGLLSSSDWTTFNNKQNALTNPVTGTGTTNYLPKFTGTSTIGNSLLYEEYGQVGLSTSGQLAFYVSGGYSFTVNGVNVPYFGLASGIETGSANASMFISGYDGLKFYTNNTLRVTLNASGNLGLGVTPSAWSTSFYNAIEGGDSNSQGAIAFNLNGTSNGVDLWANGFFDGTNSVYKYNGTAGLYQVAGNVHRWYNAPSGTAGNAISFTQAMTLNASGNLSIGNTNDTYKLDVTGTVNLGGGTTGATSGDLLIDTTSVSPKVIIGRLSSTDSDNTVLIGRNRVGVQGWQINGFGAASFNSTLAVGGAATFSSNVKATQFQLSAASGQYYYFDNASGNNFLGLTATNTLGLYVGGNLSLSIASTGAATFSSSVTAGGDVTLSGNESYLYFTSTYSVGSNTRAKIRTVGAGGGSGYGGDLRFSTRNSSNIWNEDAMTINSTGLVGIGTSSPSYLLDVSGTGRFAGRVQADGYSTLPATGSTISMGFSGGTGYLQSWSSNALAPISIDGSTFAVRVNGFATTALSINGTGAATFSSSVTAGSLITDVVRNTSGDAMISYSSNVFAVGSGNVAQEVKINAGGSERMRITTGGLVGIGTSSPSTLLYVNGYTASNWITTIYNTGASGHQMYFGYNDGSTTRYGLYIDGGQGSGSSNFDLAVANKFYVMSGGNVGIGSASPSYKLDVNGSFSTVTSSIYLQYNSGILYHFGGSGDYYQYINGANYLLYNRTATGALTFGTQDTERMRITSGGSVGINTTSPADTLHVLGFGRFTASSTAQIKIKADTVTNGFDIQNDNTGAYLWNRDNTVIYFGTNNTERMRITSSGNVEIATGSIKTGEPDTGWGRAAIKIGASVSGEAFNVTRYLPVSVDGTVYYINLNSSTP